MVLTLRIYLDDSGDLSSGKGKLYVWAGFAIKSGESRLTKKLDKIFRNFSVTPGYKEKKGFDVSLMEKRQVFECLIQHPEVRIGYLVVDKQELTENQVTFIKGSPSRNMEQSENYFLGKVIQRLSNPYQNQTRRSILVTIDGSPKRDKESAIRLHEYLSLKINYPTWNREFNWNDFHIVYNAGDNHRLLQTADFLANFILEYYKLMFYEDNPFPRKDIKGMIKNYSIISPYVHSRLLRLPKTNVF